MQRYLLPGLVAMLLLVGAYFLTGGITGRVVSESCCDPRVNMCAPDNACPFLQQVTPTGASSLYVGGAIILLGVLLALALLRREAKEGFES